MPERRGSRFALEVAFLAGLATALSFTDLRPVAVAGLMLLGWLLVALLEWVTVRAHAPAAVGPMFGTARTSVSVQVDHGWDWPAYQAEERDADALTSIAWPGRPVDEFVGWPFSPTPFEPEPEAPDFDPIALLAVRAEEHVLLAPTRSTTRLERHRIDPLREQEQSRLPWRRSDGDDVEVATMPARPDGVRMLPLRLQRTD